MRFVHLADLHLGKKLNEWSLIEDQQYILNQIIDICIDKQPDAVLICGDVYDKRVPPTDAVELLDSFLTELTRQGRRVIMIAGNHDSAERLDFGRDMLARAGLDIAGTFVGRMDCAALCDEHGPVRFWSMPFARQSALCFAMPDALARTYHEDFRAAVGLADINPDERNVILAHQFVMNAGLAPEAAGSEQFADAPEVGSVEAVDAGAFDAFDYAALGHIHRAQTVGRETVRYAGAPLPYHIDEHGQVKSIPVVTMGAKGNVSVELVPLQPKRAMRHITGPIAKLLDPANAVDTDDYIHVTLTDEVPVLDAMARVRSVYKRVVHLDYAARAANAAVTYEDEKVFRQRTLSEHFSEFYGMIYRKPPSGEAMNEVRAAARRAEAMRDEA